MIFTDRFKAVPFVILFHVCLYYTVLSFHYSLAITCWEMADLLALLCVMFPCVLSLSLMVTRLMYRFLIFTIILELKLTT